MVPRAARRALVAASLSLTLLPAAAAAPAGASTVKAYGSYGGGGYGDGSYGDGSYGGGAPDGGWWWPSDDATDPTVDPTAPTPDDPGYPGYPDPADTAPPSIPTKPITPTDPLTPVLPAITVPTSSTIAGKVALVRADGKAAIPRGAPARVRSVIAAANKIIGKPYKWGGGHAKLVDTGYDCSGSVSYALIRSGLLNFPMVSGQLAKWSAPGAGGWIAIYANRNHVYMEVAGLRFDTSPVGDPTGRMGVRWRPVIGKRQGFHTRHIVGL